MNRFTEFRGYVCTANQDGSVPLNSRVALQIQQGAAPDQKLLQQLIAQANLAVDLIAELPKPYSQGVLFAVEKHNKAVDLF